MLLVLLLLATASTTVTLARANVFKPLREFIASKNEFFGEMIHCTYCTSHWVSFFYAIFFTNQIGWWVEGPWLLRWWLLAMSLVTLSAPLQFVIVWSHSQLHPKEEDER